MNKLYTHCLFFLILNFNFILSEKLNNINFRDENETTKKTHAFLCYKDVHVDLDMINGDKSNVVKICIKFKFINI